MTPATRELIHRIAVAGQCVLIVLCMAWAILERPAPYVNVRWREGLSANTRQMAESELYLENGELAGEAWRYELASPRTADIRAIIAHPDVQDTHRIERSTATLSADAGRGTLRVWWAGPFKGADGRLEFRAVFGVLGIVSLLCTAFSSSVTQPSTFLRRWLTFRDK
jgi:hypothetical protein